MVVVPQRRISEDPRGGSFKRDWELQTSLDYCDKASY